MRLTIILLLFLLPFIVEGKTKIEAFITGHPFLFILVLLGGCAVLLGLIFLPTYLMRKFGKEMREFKKKKIMEEIPKGKVKDVHLPPAFIYFLGKKGEIQRKEIPLHSEFIIGRGKTDCGLRIEDRKISWEHAKIRPEEDGYFLYDLASKTGTKVNGRKVLKKRLENGDRIKIGRYTLIFESLPKDTKEKRKHLRISLPLQCVIFSKPQDSFSGVTRDISTGGVKFEVNAQLPIESVLEYQIFLDSAAVKGLGVVRWIKPVSVDKKKYLVGMEFLEMSESARRLLENLITSQMVEEK